MLRRCGFFDSYIRLRILEAVWLKIHFVDYEDLPSPFFGVDPYVSQRFNG